MSNKKFGIRALEYQHSRVQIVTNSNKKAADLRHQRHIKHVDRRIVDRDRRYTMVMGNTQPAEICICHVNFLGGGEESGTGFGCCSPHGILCIPRVNYAL